MLDLIVNPLAGGKEGKKIIKAMPIIESTLKQNKIEYAVHCTSYKGQAKELTESLISNGATDIITVGGDGTLHEVINGFHDFDKCNLGLIPCGTGNDFAKAVKIPTDTKKALQIIIDGKAQFTDFMQMPTIRGINIIGMGIDVDVLKKYSALKKKSKWGYTKCLIKTLCKFEYSDFKVKIDEEEKSYRSFIACIANGHDYGGGIPICPVANPTDNKLDFLAVKEMPKIKIIFAFIKLKKGKILTVSQSEHFTAQNVSVIPQGEYSVNVDGELYDNIPFDVKVVKNTLKMYRP